MSVASICQVIPRAKRLTFNTKEEYSFFSRRKVDLQYYTDIDYMRSICSLRSIFNAIFQLRSFHALQQLELFHFYVKIHILVQFIDNA